MKIFNLNADEWDRTEERDGWRFKDAWVGAHTDAELIGGSMYEVEPGNKQGPFHTHHANEEWAIVLRGEPTLRTHEGEQQLREGDVRDHAQGQPPRVRRRNAQTVIPNGISRPPAARRRRSHPAIESVYEAPL